jgi:hypothetical protein
VVQRAVEGAYENQDFKLKFCMVSFEASNLLIQESYDNRRIQKFIGENTTILPLKTRSCGNVVE